MMFASRSKDRVIVYNFGESLSAEHEELIMNAVHVMWRSAHGIIMPVPEVLFAHVLNAVAFSEDLTDERVDTLLKDCGLHDAIIQHAPYFVIPPQESSVAICLILELLRRSHFTCLPSIIRPRKWTHLGTPVTAYEAVSLNEVLSHSD